MSTQWAVRLAIAAFCLSAGLTRVPLAAQTALTFAGDVAPIVRNRCTSCHRANGPAPFPLVSYDDIARRVTQIRQVITARYMPPWQPEQGSDVFLGARRLTSSELDTMIRWIEAGMPPGEAIEDSPLVAEDLETQSKPDLVLTAEASSIGTCLHAGSCTAQAPVTRWATCGFKSCQIPTPTLAV